jgi:hypothetical protein
MRTQEVRQATRVRGALWRGQCWVRWNVDMAACVQAQSAQGMDAQKEGPRARRWRAGSGKARGFGVRRRAHHLSPGLRARLATVKLAPASAKVELRREHTTVKYLLENVNPPSDATTAWQCFVW